jgi:multiple sugar transport system permease protein
MVRESKSFRVFQVLMGAFLCVFAVAPVYVMLTSSLKPLADVESAFEWWPKNLTFQAFSQIWSTVPLALYFENSLIDCACSTLFAVIVAVFTAYGLSRYRFAGRSAFMRTVLATQMFPGVLFLLPLFLLFVNIDNALGLTVLYQTRLGLIFTFLTFNLPFAIWMLTRYLDAIPKELDESARVDGNGAVGTLLRIIVPIARPGIVAVAVYCFMTSWSEILFSSVMTNSNTATLSIGLQSYASQTDVYWNQIMAATLVVSVPIVVVFLLVQRHLISGLATGGVK